ncbi:MAG: M48 family metallopeptidase [Bacteroidaceae bacterium]|nr:M48 family metallopeptidase [Bacteroidaceae bacterium]
MLYWIIIVIEIAEYVYGQVLSLLNVKASKRPIPKVLEGIYDEASYRKQQAYFRANKRVGFWSSLISTIATIGVFAFGGFAWADELVRGVTDSEILRTLLFMGLFGGLSWLLDLPFDVYDTFVVEERFGFNKTTPKLYIMDTLKSLALGIVIGGGLLALVVWIYGLTHEWFWLLAWGVTAVVMLFIQYFYSVLLVPLFNKQTPLEEGELRDAIEAFASKVDFKLKNIYVIDGSKRSTHSNAYFTGWGRQKRIVLYDTLMEQLTTEEIVGVLAHEIGHYKHRHIVQSLFVGLLTTLVTFYLFGLIIDNPSIAAAAGSSEPSFYVNLTVFSMLYAPLTMVLGIVSSVWSRKNERQADRFALEHGVGADEASALKKMSAKSLSNLTPHPFVVFVSYSHPTLKERVETLDSRL